MLVYRIKRSAIFVICLVTLGLVIYSLGGCGGGGGGGNASNSQQPPSTQQPPTTQQAPAQIAVNLTQIVFGNTFLNKSSDQTITIQNTGSSNLNIGAIAQAHSLSAPFSIINDNCSAKQVAPSQTCTFQVQFSPTSQGGFNESFDIPSNDPNQNSVTVSVSGVGRALGVAINKVVINSCPTVEVFVTVTDTNANPISGLLQTNFSLSENGVAKPIASASQVRLPISVAMVMDYSGSVSDVAPDIQTAADSFIDQLNPSNNDEGAVIKFATAINLVQGFTTDTNALKAAINAPYTGDESETHLFDAIYSAIDNTATRPNRGAIVVLSDGNDDNGPGTAPGSVHTLTDVIAHAIAKGVNIFTIGLGDNVNVGVMNQLATGTGGQYLLAPTSSQLSAIYQQMAQIIFGQYELQYSSSSSGSSSVNLDVVVNANNAQQDVSTNFTGCP